MYFAQRVVVVSLFEQKVWCWKTEQKKAGGCDKTSSQVNNPQHHGGQHGMLVYNIYIIIYMLATYFY
jgi:hypothetical protein